MDASLFSRWVEDWARLQALPLELGGAAPAAQKPSYSKQKKELLGTRLMKLQKRGESTQAPPTRSAPPHQICSTDANGPRHNSIL